jgi:LPXTG-site transpeptidase (sortase) family protein
MSRQLLIFSMQNDIIPRRGAKRSVPRPVARPVPAMPRQMLQRAYGASPPPIVDQLSPAPVASVPRPVAPVRSAVGVTTNQPAQSAQDAPVASSLVSKPAVQTSTTVPQTLPVKPKRKWYQFSKRSLFVTILMVLILGASGYVGVDTWLTNNRLKTQLTPVAQAIASDPKARQAAEGTDTTPLPSNTLASYTVAADLPRALRIEKLNIAARILPMGVNKDNSMQAPININDSGWYNGSSKPGEAGAMVIDGHSSATNSAVHLGLFSALDTLENGDIVTVEKGDGTILSYKVIYKETVALDAVDMHKVMLPYGTAKEGLNLITCAGQWTDKNTTLDHRTIVYTERIST